MTALCQESRALFRNARTAMSPDGDARDRVRAALAAKVGAAAVGAATGATIAKAAGGATAAKAGVATSAAGVGAGTATATAAKAGSIALVAKIVTPIAIVGAAAVATPHVAPDFTRHVSQRLDGLGATTATATAAPRPTLPRGVHVPTDRGDPASKANEPAPATSPSPSATSLTADALPDAPATKTPTTPTTKTRAKPAASSATTEEEAAIIDAMERALRGGDARRAAALASEHEQKFPRGTLSEEREGGRVLARCLIGARSKDAADAFLAAHPRSPMRGRILAACASPSEKE